jgi:hypothetical protein
MILLTSGLLLQASAQPRVTLDTEEVSATIESVDQQKRMVLMRDPTGGLHTIVLGPEVQNLAQVHAGDRVVIRYTEAVAAQIVKPGDPSQPTSGMVARTAAPGDKPAGVIAEHDRERVTIEGVNLATNTVYFLDRDRVPRTVMVQQPAMRDFIRTLKVGDQVDVTFTEAIAVSVTPAPQR